MAKKSRTVLGYKKGKKLYVLRKNAATSLQAKKISRAKSIKAIRAIAKAEAEKMAEAKEQKVGYSNVGLHTYPSTNTSPNNYLANNIFDTSVAWVNIAQGTGEGQRIGNKIKLKKFMFNFIMNATTNTVRPFLVRMWVLTYKFDPNGATTADVWSSFQKDPPNANSFFDNGNAANGMGGTLLDLIQPVNTNAWIVHKCKTFKIGCASAPQGTLTGNNDYKYTIKSRVDLMKYMSKTIHYNDTSTTSFNKKIFIAFECCPADGAIIGDGGTAAGSQVVNLNCFYNIKWTDM